MNNSLVKKSLAFIAIVILIASSTIPVFASKNDFDIDEYINEFIDEAKIPSLSVCIVKNNTIVWENGYGKYNRLLGLKPTNITVYKAASITKTMTATALMQLYEKGKFKLDDDVNKYLPFSLRNPNYPEINITIWMLLSHQSSLPETSFKNYLKILLVSILFPNRFPGLAIKEHLSPNGILYANDVWTNNKPGESFNYSNEGFFILEYLVERLSNQSFDDYCNENILKPLKMYNSSFNYKEINRNQLAVPNVLIKNILVRLPMYNLAMAGAGGLSTSIEDLSHYLIAQMNNGTYENVTILNNSSIEIMRSIFFYNNDSSSVLNFDYGLGWMIYNYSGIRYYGHDGSLPGFGSRMVFSETNKTGVLIFFNRSKNGEVDYIRLDKLMNALFSKAEEL